ncbi:GCN5-related N-acetyltransferase [Clostridium sp. DL-VIII]|uniref:GNAT family N-acetyltransferase n=1 Tax=Clostridium sp. DL-VIII TaxID=641107 RepID=UPI00023AFE4A|nr:GNAT family N-acetyltransferase [Clostridium sp. DL-VIII]EHI98421.1 GCN5-related N-acetyltransferase [Clostridium sp. DL-VIII]
MDSDEDIEILVLTKKYLNKSIKLVETVFTDEEESMRKEIEASIDEKKFQKYVTKIDRHVMSIEYFTAINSKKKVIGFIGMYTLIENYENTIWLGWYCVHAKYRGRGVGKLLLDFIIDKARERGKKYICLYTSTDSNEAKAQEIYEKNGFYITERVKKNGYEILYRRKTL